MLTHHSCAAAALPLAKVCRARIAYAHVLWLILGQVSRLKGPRHLLTEAEAGQRSSPVRSRP